MKNLNAFVSDAWVKQTDAIAEKWDSLPAANKKTFSADYLKRCLDAGETALANGKEVITKVNTLKDGGKQAMDGIQKIVADQRKANKPMSDAERDWVKKGKATIDAMLPEFQRLTTEFTSNMPVIFRGSFWNTVLKKGAIDQKAVDKIMAKRLEGINVSNDFGKQSPVVARMQEYAQRYPILAAELVQLEKDRTGKGHEGAGDLAKKVQALEAGNKAWDDALDNKIATLVGSISSFFDGKIDKDAKGFGASLIKNVKLLVSAKEKAKDKAKAKVDQMTVQTKMTRWPADLKAVKGTLKTRRMEQESLAASLKNMGEPAAPFRKMLDAIKVSLDKREQEVDALVKQVDEALTALKK